MGRMIASIQWRSSSERKKRGVKRVYCTALQKEVLLSVVMFSASSSSLDVRSYNLALRHAGSSGTSLTGLL